MYLHCRKADFKYKTEPCKHYLNGKCHLGIKCRFTHGIIEKRNNNAYKYFNFFDNVENLTENDNSIQNKADTSQNYIIKNPIDLISEKDKLLIFKENAFGKELSKDELEITNTLDEIKNLNLSETKKSNLSLDHNCSKYNKNKSSKKNKLKQRENKETAIKFKNKNKNANKKNNLEILYADPNIACFSFKNSYLNFKKMKSVNRRDIIDIDKGLFEKFNSKSEFNTKVHAANNFQRTIQILDDSFNDNLCKY